MQQTRETFAQAIAEMRERIQSGKPFADQLIARWNQLDRQAQAK